METNSQGLLQLLRHGWYSHVPHLSANQRPEQMAVDINNVIVAVGE